nr:rho-gtpase-activating protein 8 [Quercus suber]
MIVPSPREAVVNRPIIIGLGVLFGKLQQGVHENEQILTLTRLRADAEDLYGQRLADIEPATNKIEGGFQRDDGASVKKVGETSRVARERRADSSRHSREYAPRWARLRVTTARSPPTSANLWVEDVDEEEKLAFQDPNSAAATGSPKQPPQSVPSIKVEEEEDEPESIEIGDEVYPHEQLKKILAHALENVRLGETKVPILGTYQNVSTGSEIVEYIQKHMGGSTVALAEKIGQDLINNGFLRLIGNMGNSFANSSRMNYQWRAKAFQLTGLPEKRPKLMSRTSTMASSVSDTASIPDSPAVGERMSEYLGGWNPLNNAHPNETPAEKLRRETREADERYKAAVRKLDGLRCNLEEAMVDHLKFMERCEVDRLKAIKSVILDFSGSISNVIPSLQSTVDNMMLFQETVQPINDVRYLLENYRTGNYIPRVTVYENYYNTVDEQTFGVDIEARARSDRKRIPLIVTTILTFLDQHYPDLEGDEARRGIWTVDVPLGAAHHLRNQINTGMPVPPQLLDKYEVPIVAAVLKLYLLELPDSLVSSHVYEIVKTIYTTTAQNASDTARVQVIQSTLGQLRLANIATLDALITHFARLIELTNADEAYVNTLATILAPCIMRPKQQTGLSMAEKYNVRLVKDLFAHKDAIFGELKRQSSLTHTNSGSTRATRAISTDESKRREHMEERQRAIAAAREAHSTSGHRTRQHSPSGGSRVALPDGTSVRRDRSRGPETRFPVSTAAAQTSADHKNVRSPTSSVTSSHRDSLSVPRSPPPSTRLTYSTTSPPKASEARTPPKTNGSIHQPPPRDDTPEDDLASVRDSIGPTKRASIPPTMSASISGPQDFMGSNHFYGSGGDSPTTSITSSTAAPEKRDSLNRAGARGSYPRKAGTGGMKRQSLVVSSLSNRDSVEGASEHSAVDSPIDVAARSAELSLSKETGVQLEDKPMDFD